MPDSADMVLNENERLGSMDMDQYVAHRQAEDARSDKESGPDEAQVEDLEELRHDAAEAVADRREMESEGGADEEPADAPSVAAPKSSEAPPSEGPAWSHDERELIDAAMSDYASVTAEIAKLTGPQYAQRLMDLPQPDFEAAMGELFNRMRPQVERMAGGDRARHAALLVDWREAQKRIVDRHADLTAVAGVLNGKAQQHWQEQIKRRITDEAAKLAKALPDLDKKALVPYLKSAGFTDQDIKSAADHRLVVLAEKARRYDEMTRTPPSAADEADVLGNMSMAEYARWRESGEPVPAASKAPRKKYVIPKMRRAPAAPAESGMISDPTEMTMDEYVQWRKTGKPVRRVSNREASAMSMDEYVAHRSAENALLEDRPSPIVIPLSGVRQ